jgi:hypothetical protein
VSFDVLNIIELGSQWVVDIDDDDLPVSLLFIQQGHDTEDLDLLDLSSVPDQLADLADVQWVVIALGLGLGVDDVGVLPGLEEIVSYGEVCENKDSSYLREGTIVPEVTLVWEAVSDESKLALLCVLHYLDVSIAQQWWMVLQNLQIGLRVSSLLI